MEDNTIVIIIVSGVIGLGIALFVKYGIIPKIETVYHRNRNLMIKGLLIEANNISNQFDDAHEIFERQQNFVAGEDRAYNLTENEVAGLRLITAQIRRVFDDVRQRKDFLLFHFTIDELETILNYIANTFSFYTVPENEQPDQNGRLTVFYFPIRVDVMRRFGWKLINMFPQIINYDFIQRIRRYDGFQRLE